MICAKEGNWSLVLLFVLFAGGCTYHRVGMLSSKMVPANYKYSDVAVGVSEARYVLGFGGAKKDALVLEAKQNMISNRPLKMGETYGDITVDYQYRIFFITEKVRVVVSADIIAPMKKGKDSTKYSSIYKDKINFRQRRDSLFAVGDTVYDETGERYLIHGFREKNRVFLSSVNQHSAGLKLKTVSSFNIFSQKHTINQVVPGITEVTTLIGIKGIVQGVGRKKVLVRFYNGDWYAERYGMLSNLKEIGF